MNHPPATPGTVQPAQPLLEKARLTRLKDAGPTLHEVATQLLRGELKTLYPDLDIDPDKALVATPAWSFDNDELTLQGIHYESLSRILMRQSVDASIANYLEGEHFLTQDPEAEPTVLLGVSIETIARMLNDFAPKLFLAFEARQLAYWNATPSTLPRWQVLSDSLRKALNIRKVHDWDADHCAIAQAVSAFPDKQERRTQRPDMADIQVCLIDIDTPDGITLKHLQIVGCAVLHGRYKERDILLMYTVENGYERFASLQALGSALPSRLGTAIASKTFSWRLIEPDGNFFDHMAWALINTQLLAIESLNRPNLAPSFTLPSDQEQARLDQLQHAIPDWLLHASAHELSAYSDHLIDLSTLRDQTPKELFNLPPIKAFAQKKMREAIIADRTAVGAAALPLDDLSIVITDSFIAGVFTLPNPFDHHTQTLGEFALSNTRPYLADIRFKHGHAVPDWLTVSYLTKMAEQVDIGRVYPQLIKSKLIDDPLQAPLQKNYYIQQLRILLPLLALECKVRHLGDVDEQGYRYINELVRPTPDSRQPIVIRPLNLRPQHRISSQGDDVLNMFTIGPRNPQEGPCLLYRPLLENPLQQFPSYQNLLYSMHQPGELRDSILAWLPTQALSFNYAQYLLPIGLPSPWLVVQPLSEPLSLLEWAGTLEFSSVELTDDIFAALYTANTQAMIELADRQSQSNAQRRWALLEDSGWAVFNVASNFLNGYAGAAVWVWQVINDIQQALDAHERKQSPIQWERLGDVLMALATVIALRANQRRTTGSPRPAPHLTREHVNTVHEPIATPIRATATVATNKATPHSQYAAIASEGSVPRRTPAQLDRYLDTLTVTPPDLNDQTLTTLDSGDAPPLYQLHNKTYARAADRWFEVLQDEDENTQVLNPQDPSRSGPRLAHTPNRTWRVDTSLRLLGSGRSLKSQLKTSRLAKAQRRQELEQQVSGFKAQETTLKEELRTLYRNITQYESTPLYEHHLQQCQDKTEAIITLYDQALVRHKAWRDAGGTAGYVQELFRLHAEYQRHLALWLSIKQISYGTVMKRVEQDMQNESLPDRQALMDDIKRGNQLGQQMLTKLKQIHQRLAELPDIGAAGLIVSTRLKALAPRFTEWDVKTNEIATSYELCIREQAAQDMEQARLSVSYVVHRAAMASKDMAQMMRAAPSELSAPEQIEQLITLVDDYSSISQRIKEVPDDYPDRVEPQHLARLQTLVEEFQHLAQSTLANLLAANASSAATAGPSRARPKIKVTKTRPRDPPTTTPEAADQASMTLIQPKQTRPSSHADDYVLAISTGIDLSLDAKEFIKRTQQDALRPKRVPADMQDIFDQQAQRLEQSATTLDTHMSNALKAGQSTPVATLPLELREAATQLRREGIATRARMLKARKPRQSDLQWMLDNHLVRVIRNAAGRIKTLQQDYFQEYQILDIANRDQPLWLAHFHYPNLKTPAHLFSAAHLKIADQHLTPLSAEVQVELTTRTPLDNQLRKLTDPVMQAVFLALERPIAH